MNQFDTHAVLNQAPAFVDVNLFDCDPALCAALVAQGGDWATQELSGLGARLGRAGVAELARQANVNGPQLHTFDRSGRRIDELEFHPSWHALMTMIVGAGAHSAPWLLPRAGAQVARAAGYLLFAQVENGIQCPLTMTYAAVPALRRAGGFGARWLEKILSNVYDPRSLPIAEKNGALIGMGMTEKQGGSDVRANTTRATAIPDAEAVARFGADATDAWRLVGHKWFFSVPQADAHLVLAQTEEQGSSGLSCFFVPRFLPDGSRNAVRLQRLKDKLGNRSNASSEVEFCDAVGWLLGARGRGIPTILEMGSHTRLDCVIGSAGIMRAALCHALHHARARSAFGAVLAQQALMQNVLADLAIESEAATAFALRLARCFDHPDDPIEQTLARLLTPAGKYWLCKRGPGFMAEAMEVMGGNGYVEEGPLARLYREAPVNSIWEGSGNVMCLDLLRALQKAPEAACAALSAEFGPACALDARFAHYVAQLEQDMQQANEGSARVLAERLVIAVQGACLLRYAPPFVAEAFMVSRIVQDVGGVFGRLPAGLALDAILARALIMQ